MQAYQRGSYNYTICECNRIDLNKALLYRSRSLGDKSRGKRLYDALLSFFFWYPRFLLFPDGSCAGSQVCIVEIRQLITLWWLLILALDRIDVKNVHGINLFKSAAMTIANKQINHHCTREATCSENVAI